MLKNKRQSSTESSETEPEKKDDVDKFRNLPKRKEQESFDAQRKIDSIQPQKVKENNSLFAEEEEEDADDDLFKTGLFSNFSADKTKNMFENVGSGLFDDINEDQSNASTKKFEESKKAEANNRGSRKSGGELKKKHGEGNDTKVKSPSNLFYEHDESDSDDLFSSKRSKIITKDKVLESSSVTKNELVKTEPPPIKIKEKKAPSLFDDDLDNEDDDLFSSNFLKPKKITTRKSEEKRKNLFGEDDEDDLFSVKESSKTSDDIFGRSKLFEPTVEENNEVIGDKDAFKSNDDDTNCDATSISQSDNLSDKVLINSIGATDRNTAEETPNKDVVYSEFPESGELFVSTKVSSERLGEMESTNENNDEDRATTGDLIHSIETTNISPQIEDKLVVDFEEPPTEESEDSKQSQEANKNEFLNELKSELQQNDSEKDFLNALTEDGLQINENQLVDSSDRTKNPFSSTANDRIPTVNIFDPTPPPDLGDWDTRSEQNISYDDIYTFDNSENLSENRSSIFDREPPSVFNESSGIVRDQSAG